MSRQTDNKKVVKVLSNALTAFLDDQRAFAHEDPEWLEEFKGMSQDERDKMPGCGCEDFVGDLTGANVGEEKVRFFSNHSDAKDRAKRMSDQDYFALSQMFTQIFR